MSIRQFIAAWIISLLLILAMLDVVQIYKLPPECQGRIGLLPTECHPK